MTDLTAPLNELRAAYRAYQDAKRNKKYEIQEKYRTRIEDEIRDAVAAEKYAFAKRLKDLKEFYDLRVTDIQDHVLRTRNWKIWEDLRDAAGLAPEFISRENAREARKAAEAASTWDFEEGLFYIRRGPEGNVISDPVAYRIDSIRRAGYDRTKWFADPLSESRERAEKTGLNLHAVIQEAIDNKIIDAPEEES